MYRENAAPQPETLHALVVRPSSGMTAVALLFSGALVCAVVLVVLLVAAREGDDMAAAQIACAVGVLAFGGLASVLHAKRKRTLRIERIGERHRLTIDKDGVELGFPLACHGTQFVSKAGRLDMHEVYLQLVDGNRAVLLHEIRGAIYGPQADWFDSDIDKKVTSALYDVPGADQLAKLRALVNELNRTSS